MTRDRVYLAALIAGVALFLWFGVGPLLTGGLSDAYRDCDEARAAGAAPVYEDDPGYHLRLDADGDGVGCEPWP